jgi:lysophospholipase L1-like esterase
MLRTWAFALGLASLAACGRCRSRPAPAAVRSAESVLYVGRVDRSDRAGVRFAWPGSAVRAHFRGTGIDVTLADSGVSRFDVVVDGRAHPVLVTGGAERRAYPLARDLPAGEHDVELTKRTETFFGTTEVFGFDVVGGALAPGALVAPRMIEYVGDSITCGYGVTGAGPACPFGPDTEVEPEAYAARAARLLGAEHASIAWSGRGMVVNANDDATDPMPALWERTLADRAESAWGFTEYTPDVVVVDLGTNDFWKGDPGPRFGKAYDAFLARVRSRYAQAYVVAFIGPMLDGDALKKARAYVDAAVDAAHARGDARLSSFEVPPQSPKDGYGCDYHPSAATHAKVAERLADEIRRVTGW